MKILVCTDGSEQSKAILEEASRVVEEHNPEEVVILHVYQSSVPPYFGEYISKDRLEYLKKLEEKQNEEVSEILTEVLETLKKKNIKARTFMQQGVPSEIIAKVALEEEFDMIVVCSEGRGGLRKIVRRIRDVSSKQDKKQDKTKTTLIPALFLRRKES